MFVYPHVRLYLDRFYIVGYLYSWFGFTILCESIFYVGCQSQWGGTASVAALVALLELLVGVKKSSFACVAPTLWFAHINHLWVEQ